MGLFDEIGSLFGRVVGTAAGLALAPLAIVLDVTEEMVKEAIDAGCETVEEIKEFCDLESKRRGRK